MHQFATKCSLCWYGTGLYESCSGLPNCGEGTKVVNDCDWCASNNHPHFDLDIGAFDHICDTELLDGSCRLTDIKPVTCMKPNKWPPTSSGGGGYISCPKDTWDTGGMEPLPSCDSGQYLYPGDPNWEGSETATHLCCTTKFHHIATSSTPYPTHHTLSNDHTLSNNHPIQQHHYPTSTPLSNNTLSHTTTLSNDTLPTTPYPTTPYPTTPYPTTPAIPRHTDSTTPYPTPYTIII